MRTSRERVVEDAEKEVVKVEKKPTKLGKPKTSRIVSAVSVGCVFSLILGFIVYGLYMNYIKYPPQMKYDESKTGLYCLNNWVDSICSLESLGEGSYINQEIQYANGDSDKLNFYKKVFSTVNYTPEKVTAKNIYGYDYMDRGTGDTVKVDSTIEEGESVTFSYIDYSKVVIDEKSVKDLMIDAKLSLGDVDYENKLVDVFCRYMCNLSNVPIKTVKDYVPKMSKNSDGTYYMLQEEDIYLDKLLLSSSDLYSLMDRFSIVAGKVTRDVDIQPTSEWLTWSDLSNAEKGVTAEPPKYNPKQVVSKLWCGVYYLQNEYTEENENGDLVQKRIDAELGTGTVDNPLGLNTDTVTYVYVDGEPYPIRVSMVEYGVSEDAIKWIESKDEKNRGIDITSEVQFCYYIFKITNLSDRELTINDNSGICDINANLAPRTGVLYNIKDTVTLQPDETGYIESWNKSTELNKKYVIWGADFARRIEPVWFRVLAGDVDNPNDDKGVTLNKTRK